MLLSYVTDAGNVVQASIEEHHALFLPDTWKTMGRASDINYALGELNDGLIRVIEESGLMTGFCGKVTDQVEAMFLLLKECGCGIVKEPELWIVPAADDRGKLIKEDYEAAAANHDLWFNFAGGLGVGRPLNGTIVCEGVAGMIAPEPPCDTE